MTNNSKIRTSKITEFKNAAKLSWEILIEGKIRKKNKLVSKNTCRIYFCKCKQREKI